MNNLQIGFLIFFFLIQLLLPLRHYQLLIFSKRGAPLTKSQRCLFSWTMVPYVVQSEFYLSAFDQRSGERIGVYSREDFLNERQRKFLYFGPGEAVQLAHFLQLKLHQKKGIPLDQIDIRGYEVADVNENGATERMTEDVNLCQERLRFFSQYPWWKG